MNFTPGQYYQGACPDAEGRLVDAIHDPDSLLEFIILDKETLPAAIQKNTKAGENTGLTLQDTTFTKEDGSRILIPRGVLFHADLMGGNPAGTDQEEPIIHHADDPVIDVYPLRPTTFTLDDEGENPFKSVGGREYFADVRSLVMMQRVITEYFLHQHSFNSADAG
jgi:hypothetical protein